MQRSIVLMHPSIHETEVYSGEQAGRMAQQTGEKLDT
jgi:hypothetical protein